MEVLQGQRNIKRVRGGGDGSFSQVRFENGILLVLICILPSRSIGQHISRTIGVRVEKLELVQVKYDFRLEIIMCIV